MAIRFRLLSLFVAAAALAQQPTSPFLSIAPAASDSLQFGALLPEFEAKDRQGRTWRSEDLRGKFTLIYIWGASLAQATDTLHRNGRGTLHGLPDIPELQRFYDEVRNAKNIQVLTFCDDYDCTHAHDYMKQSAHTFPVIADWTLVKKLFPGVSTEYCVINPEGRLSYPFRSWTLGRVLFEVERAAAGK